MDGPFSYFNKPAWKQCSKKQVRLSRYFFKARKARIQHHPSDGQWRRRLLLYRSGNVPNQLRWQQVRSDVHCLFQFLECSLDLCATQLTAQGKHYADGAAMRLEGERSTNHGYTHEQPVSTSIMPPTSSEPDQNVAQDAACMPREAT
jgi:hypothetical protein